MSYVPSSSTMSTLPPDYQDLTADEKQRLLWKNVVSNPYSLSNLPTNQPSALWVTQLLNPIYDRPSFVTESDEMPEGRVKIIHTYGSVAKVELRITQNSSFTGIFRSGGIGLARLSLARQNDANFIPAMALKVLVDGRRSQNFHVMNALQGQGLDRNFFSKDFYNVVDDTNSFAVNAFIKSSSGPIALLPGSRQDKPEDLGNLGLVEEAAVTSEGAVVENILAPYKVTFVPNGSIGWDPHTKEDLRVHLDRIPEGTVLYTVCARRTRTSHDELLGELVLQSKFVASPYGDEVLFFQHASKRWHP
ncbi:hypothetical protein RvY_06960-2 [Ramazzottius varieornatus]|uniref:Uncharacterized protein n=1 Tax=Ramazzottius varieornatus TaxID=947166 RepID=A0A1D1V0D1_RAMVA|nr:hypothetical protein RvY_06960-2 [Ramazzottius varieornatus]